MGPTAMIVGGVISAIGTLGSYVMSSMQSNAQAKLARQQAQYARNMAARNAAIAEQSAQAALAKGRYEAGIQREQTRRLMSKQLALGGASGLDPSTSSILNVLTGTAYRGERDAQTTLYNAAYEAWKLRTSGETSLIEGNAQASRYDQQADYLKSSANTSLLFAPLAVGSSILTSYNNYRYYNQGALLSGGEYAAGG